MLKTWTMDLWARRALKSVTYLCILDKDAFELFRSSKGKLSCSVELAFAWTLLAESLSPRAKLWDFSLPVPLGKEQFGLTSITS